MKTFLSVLALTSLISVGSLVSAEDRCYKSINRISLPEISGDVLSATFSADGKRYLVRYESGGKHRIQVYSTGEWKKNQSISCKSPDCRPVNYTLAAFSPTSDCIVYCNGNEILRQDTNGTKATEEILFDKRSLSGPFSLTGDFIWMEHSVRNNVFIRRFVADSDKILSLTRRDLPQPMETGVLSNELITFSDPSWEGAFEIMNIRDEKKLRIKGTHDVSPSVFAMSTNGEYLATGGNDGVVILWRKDKESYGQIQKLAMADLMITSVSFNSDNSRLVFTSADRPRNCFIYDIKSRKTAEIPGGPQGSFFARWNPTKPNELVVCTQKDLAVVDVK